MARNAHRMAAGRAAEQVTEKRKVRDDEREAGRANVSAARLKCAGYQERILDSMEVKFGEALAAKQREIDALIEQVQAERDDVLAAAAAKLETAQTRARSAEKEAKAAPKLRKRLRQ